MIRDMTKGNIYNHIVQFSIPIILGNIFQLTYNAVDSIIVGKFAGTKALAAVGTSDPIVNMLILGISGICIGASVLMSEFFGAKIYEDIKNEFATTISIGMGIYWCTFYLSLQYLFCWFEKYRRFQNTYKLFSHFICFKWLS